MDIGATFRMHPEAAKLMQLGEYEFDNPMHHSEMASISGGALAELRANASLPQGVPITFVVVTAARLHALGFDEWPAAPTGDRCRAIEQWREQSRVVTAGHRQDDDAQRRAVAVDEEIVVAPDLAPISRVRAGFFHRRWHEPMNYRQSCAKSRAGRCGTVWQASDDEAYPTPVFCQSRARCWYVMSDPQPFPRAVFSRICPTAG